MNSIIRKAALGAAIASVGVASPALAATTDTAQATAEILSTLSVDVVGGDSTLNFGVIADDGLTAASTVVVSPGEARTCGVDLVCSGTVNAPTFNITGLAGSQVAVSFPSATATLNRPGPLPAGMTNVMTVSALTTDLASNPTTLGAGATPFHVGGTLTVNPLQAPGVYTGSFAVSVAYN